jgi:hypothetical protein
MEEKRCSYCKKPKNINAFSPGEWNRVGNKHTCRACARDNNSRYRPNLALRQSASLQSN